MPTADSRWRCTRSLADPEGTGRRNSSTPATDDHKPAIVTIRRHKHAKHAHLVEDLTPEEIKHRGDAAQELRRELVRRARGTMTRAELIAELAASYPYLREADVDLITEALARGQRVSPD
jgi:hypothetical protein